VQCQVDDLTPDELSRLSREARRYFGDPGYRILANVTTGRMAGFFEAERADVVEQWLERHGATIESLAAFDAEAEAGHVYAWA
jgi:hypothetical protein